MSDAQLNEIEELAGLFFSNNEISLIIEVPVHQLNGLEAQRSILKGRLKNEALVRKAIFEHAKNGSSPAQSLAIKIIEDLKVISA